jgi:hypothetical protein
MEYGDTSAIPTIRPRHSRKLQIAAAVSAFRRWRSMPGSTFTPPANPEGADWKTRPRAVTRPGL